MIDPKTEPTNLPLYQLLESAEVQVINIGLSRFADTFEQEGMQFIQVDWRPPPDGLGDLAGMLDVLNH
jgi:hypothetical protein